MIKYITIICLMLLPAYVYSFDKTNLVGEWEIIGYSFELESNQDLWKSALPNNNTFYSSGKYEYVQLPKDEHSAIVGSWDISGKVITINRPDSGTAKYKVISYENSILSVMDVDMETFKYFKRK